MIKTRYNVYVDSIPSIKQFNPCLFYNTFIIHVINPVKSHKLITMN